MKNVNINIREIKTNIWKYSKYLENGPSNILILCSYSKISHFDDQIKNLMPFADVLKNRYSQVFRNIHRKATVLESLLNKVAGQRASNFIKMRIQHRCFQVKFSKFLATPFFYRTAPVAASVCKSDSQILKLSYKQE